MVMSYARAGASRIAIGARTIPPSLSQDIQTAAQKAGRQPPQILTISTDVTSEQSITDAATLIAKTFNGKLDVLIVSAGVLGSIIKIIESNPADWWNTMTINLRGPYLLSRAFIPLLLQGNLKTLINVCSVGAHLTTPGGSSYQTSKLAQLRLTEFLATEYADDGLIAYAIHPGNVLTDILGPDGPSEGLKHVFTETPELPGDTVVHLTKERRVWLSGRYVNCTWDVPQLLGMEREIVEGNKLKVRLVY